MTTTIQQTESAKKRLQLEGMAQNKQVVELEGIITEALPNTMFRVKIADTAPEDYKSRVILCTLNGKMRMYRIRVIPGDEVRIEVTPYDKDRGRITFRKREPSSNPSVA